MSNVFQPKNKELAKVKVVSSAYYNANRQKLKFIGSVQRGYTAFITTQKNIKTGLRSFIDNTSSLTKKSKNEIVRFFSDNNNSKKNSAYLVVEKENLTIKKQKNNFCTTKKNTQ